MPWVRSPQGKLGQVPDAKFQDALSAGYTYVPDEDVARMRAEKAASVDTAGKVGAYSTSALDIATFGHGTKALAMGGEALGIQSEEESLRRVREAQAAHPGYAIAGSITGALVPFGAPRALGGLAARGAARLGMGPVSTLVAREAVEGAAFGYGDYIAEAHRTGRAVDGEKLFQVMTHSAAFGAGVAGTIGLAAKGMGRLADAAGDAVTGLASPESRFTKWVTRETMKTLPGPEHADAFGKFDVRTEAGRSHLHLARDAPKIRAAFVDEARVGLQSVADDFAALNQAVTGERKVAEIGAKVTANYDEAITTLMKDVDSAELLLQKLELTPNSWPVAEVTRLRKYMDSELGRIGLSRQASGLGDGGWVTIKKVGTKELFIAGDNIKRQFTNAIDSLVGKDGKYIGHAGARDLATQLRAVRGTLAEGLEQKMWGKAGDFQRVINEAFRETIPEWDHFIKKFTEEGARGRMVTDASMRSFIEHTGPGGLTDLNSAKRKAWVDGLTAVEARTKAIQAVGDLTPDELAASNRLLARVDGLRSGSTRVSEAGKAQEALELIRSAQATGETGADMVSKIPLLGDVGVIGSGLMLGPGFGTAAYATRTFMKMKHRPYDTLRFIHWLNEKVYAKADAINGAVKGATAAAVNSVNGAASMVTKPILAALNSGDTETSVEDVHDSASMSTLDDVVRDVYAAAGDLATTAPDIVGEAIDTADRARGLFGALSPYSKESLALGDERSRASAVFSARYMRMVNAVRDPEKAMVAIRSGRLISDEVFAIRVVYPKEYQRVAEAMVDEVMRLGENGDKLPYPMRINTSIMTRVPMDGTQRIQYRSEMAAYYASSKQAMQSTQQSKGTPKRRRNADGVNDEYETGSERTVRGEGK